jgi:hypothetical protein
MKKLFFTAFLLVSIQFANAQINAVTESGDQVILFENGTWKYLNDSVVENAVIPVNTKEFVKSKQSTFLVKSNKLNIGIWINPKDWSFTKGKDDEVQEYQFQKKGDDLYAMLIAEKMQIPIETLKGIAIENARKVAPDVKVIKEEYRTVNGIKVFMMQMSGTLQGMRFTYFGYYYSNSNGTIQLMTYTSENLMNDYLDDIELFLNGFVEL